MEKVSDHLEMEKKADEENTKSKEALIEQMKVGKETERTNQNEFMHVLLRMPGRLTKPMPRTRSC